MSDTDTEAPPARKSFVDRLYEPARRGIESVGEHLMLLGQVVYWAVRPPYRTRLFIDANDYIGVGSLPIITLVGLFTGAVTALQAVNAMRIFGAEGYVGSMTGLSLALHVHSTNSPLLMR